MTCRDTARYLAVTLLLMTTAGCAAGGRAELDAAVAEAETAVLGAVRALNPDAGPSDVETRIVTCDEARHRLEYGFVTARLDDVGGDPIGVVADYWPAQGLEVVESRQPHFEMAYINIESDIDVVVQWVPGFSVTLHASTLCYRP